MLNAVSVPVRGMRDLYGTKVAVVGRIRFRPRQGNEGFVFLGTVHKGVPESFRPRQGNEGFVSLCGKYQCHSLPCFRPRQGNEGFVFECPAVLHSAPVAPVAPAPAPDLYLSALLYYIALCGFPSPSGE